MSVGDDDSLTLPLWGCQLAGGCVHSPVVSSAGAAVLKASPPGLSFAFVVTASDITEAEMGTETATGRRQALCDGFLWFVGGDTRAVEK